MPDDLSEKMIAYLDRVAGAPAASPPAPPEQQSPAAQVDEPMPPALETSAPAAPTAAETPQPAELLIPTSAVVWSAESGA